jgi:hypothetical protein
MKRHYLLIALGVYMLAMGVIGWLRTDAATPLLITGTIGVITILFGIGLRGGSRNVLTYATIWVGLNVLVDTYLTIATVPAHDARREGSEWIFGTMAFFSALVLISLIGELRRRHTPPNL